jgi:Flp pilus assembly pilin Flp
LKPENDEVYAYRRNGLPGQRRKGAAVIKIIRQLWGNEQGQDVAEYAVMLAVILVIVIGTVRLIGGNANNVFSQVQSQVAQ